MIPITIVSLNAYLVAKKFNNNRITFPEKRASIIRGFLRDKQLSFLQEVWGSGLENLINDEDKNTDTGFTIPPGRSSFSFLGPLEEMANTLYLHYHQTGGLYDLAEEGIECQYRHKHTFTVSRSKSKKGVEATLWKIPQWDDRHLLVFNTHLDPWHPINRQQQVKEIFEFMDETLGSLVQRRQDWSQTAVLVVGDFNIKASSSEYDEMHQREWHDFFLDEIQDTYAHENLLVSYTEDCGRIDYVFGVYKLGKYTFLPLECLSRTIQKQPKGEEFSDHYPLVMQLIPKVDDS
jgi:hypothetical protein